jgi:hypothetical protein
MTAGAWPTFFKETTSAGSTVDELEPVLAKRPSKPDIRRTARSPGKTLPRCRDQKANMLSTVAMPLAITGNLLVEHFMATLLI